MCIPNKLCHTLAMGNAFHWCRNNDGVIRIQREGGLRSIAIGADVVYGAFVELLAAQPDGTPLGANATGEVPENSLGALLDSMGMARPAASHLAAIAVDEGLADYELLGNRRGILLYPAPPGARRGGLLAAEGAVFEVVEPAVVGGDVIVDHASNSLIDLADRVRNSLMPHQRNFAVQTTELKVEAVPAFVSELGSWGLGSPESKYIYRFSVDSMDFASSLHDSFQEAKVNAVGGRRYSRLNSSECNSMTLYVGSSNSLKSRITQHLGYSYPATYSLHMKYWPGLEDCIVRLEVLQYSAEIDTEVLQALEDALWDMSQPLFGRRGAR